MSGFRSKKYPRSLALTVEQRREQTQRAKAADDGKRQQFVGRDRNGNEFVQLACQGCGEHTIIPRNQAPPDFYQKALDLVQFNDPIEPLRFTCRDECRGGNAVVTEWEWDGSL